VLNIHSKKVINATETNTIKKEIWRVPNLSVMDTLPFPKQKGTGGQYQRSTPPRRGYRFLRLHRLQILEILETCQAQDMVQAAVSQGNILVLWCFLPDRALKAAQQRKGAA